MMGWKKRSRRWRGASPLSVVSVSCGLIFVLGNLYVLHSGFSQAYRDMAAVNDHPEPGLRDDWRHDGGGSEDAAVLEGLPLLALEAIGYMSGGAGRAWGAYDADAGKVVNFRAGEIMAPSENVRAHGFGDARLRKLMGNRRDWGSDTQQSFQRKLQLQQLPAQLPVYSAGNTGRKQRTTSARVDTATTPFTAHSLNVNDIKGNRGGGALYFKSQEASHGAQSRSADHRTGENHHGGVRGGPPSRVADVPAAELRRLLWSGSRCDYVRRLEGREYVGSGWTKAVYRADDPARGGPVAVKTVDLAGHDMAACGERPGMGPLSCYTKASHKLLKEMLLLQALSDPHIIKMLGYCVPQKAYNGDADSLVVMVTELGETIDIIRLLQMSWEDRLRVSHGVTRLLRYLADSPYGSVSLNDFRRQQFVLVHGDVTLTDLDDVGFEEPLCDVTHDCIHYFSSTNFTLRTPCVAGRCEGFNERKNVFNAARHFTTFLLPHGAPPALRPAIDAIIHAYSNATLRAGELLTLLDNVVERYRTGDYIKRTAAELINRYTVHPDADLPGLFDYRCRFSIASGCTLSVLDQREAEQLCDLDPECKAFVISDELTWTGRMIVHLKNNVTMPTRRPGMSLCVKPAL